MCGYWGQVRVTPEELAEVETAAEGAGKTLAEWLRELALKAARERPADPTELLLAEVSALRYMLLNLFHATAQANAEASICCPIPCSKSVTRPTRGSWPMLENCSQSSLPGRMDPEGRNERRSDGCF